MRNQTKFALVASILAFTLGVAWFASEWSYHSYRSVLVIPAEYETVEKTPIEKAGTGIALTTFCLGIALVIFLVVAPKDILTDG